MTIMQALQVFNNQHEENTFTSSTSTLTSGPLPKSDSVQSLVSLMNCPTGYSAPTTTSHPLTVRGIDADANTHSILLNSQITSISLSALSLATVTLTSLLDSSVALNIKEISLSANSLEVVDLSPLISCVSLSVLTLNSNHIASIDLTPLASCTKLERLWLHDNRLELIDLSPLSSCKSLRSLYLEDNSLHNQTIDLSPLSQTQNLRSLRLGGNRLCGQVDLTPLLQCPALSVFQIDTSIQLVADGESSQARVSPALRRIVLDINFTGKYVPSQSRVIKSRTTPPVTPRGNNTSRRKQNTASAGTIPPVKRSSIWDVTQQQPSIALQSSSSTVVNVLLIGFRRLARYAVEDAFARTGKVVIRAADNSVATSNPQLILDSHLIILYAPMEKTLRNITVVVGSIPTIILGSQRYRSTADKKMMELLELYKFFSDPMNETDTKIVYEMGIKYATESNGDIVPSNIIVGNNSMMNKSLNNSSPLSDDEDGLSTICTDSMRRSYSESSLCNALRPVRIELEDIEDGVENEDDDDDDFPRCMSQQFMPRSKSSDGFEKSNHLTDVAGGPAQTWSEIMRRLRERGHHRVGRGWGNYQGGDLSMHGRNKLRTEHAAVAAEFSDLGGYATSESCIGVARACGLPKCSASILFRAAYGSALEIESTTPEAGVPNPPLERKRKISADAFLAYWDARLKAFDGEERLCNILEDSHRSLFTVSDCNSGHSEFGAPLLKARSSNSIMTDHINLMYRRFSYDLSSSSIQAVDVMKLVSRSKSISSDIHCPCDAGVEELVTSFMEARSARFGSFSLVKMSEAIAIGCALIIYELRSHNHSRVGGHARSLCPREVRAAKLNAALNAAEVGIFDGVAAGLSMDKIRSIKGLFATEAAPGAISRSGGVALNCNLEIDEVQGFCATRKTLLPGAVELLMAVHCRDSKRMSLAEFSVFLNVLNNISSNGAIDYMFTIIDVDQDEKWTLPDLRHFHMEKERVWLNDGMAISDLTSFWVNLLDMIGPKDGDKGITRRDLRKLGVRERKHVIQSLLFVDDDHSLLNVRRTFELKKHSTNPVLIM